MANKAKIDFIQTEQKEIEKLFLQIKSKEALINAVIDELQPTERIDKLDLDSLKRQAIRNQRLRQVTEGKKQPFDVIMYRILSGYSGAVVTSMIRNSYSQDNSIKVNTTYFSSRLSTFMATHKEFVMVEYPEFKNEYRYWYGHRSWVGKDGKFIDAYSSRIVNARKLLQQVKSL